jgi:hypothetical protein
MGVQRMIMLLFETVRSQAYQIALTGLNPSLDDCLGVAE